MLEQWIPVWVSRALHPGQTLKNGHPITELLGSLIFSSLRRAARRAQLGSSQTLVVELYRGHSLWQDTQNWNCNIRHSVEDLQTARWPSTTSTSYPWQLGHWKRKNFWDLVTQLNSSQKYLDADFFWKICKPRLHISDLQCQAQCTQWCHCES